MQPTIPQKHKQPWRIALAERKILAGAGTWATGLPLKPKLSITHDGEEERN